jgi:glycosyltransferase involved in cell wall biosynthesis
MKALCLINTRNHARFIDECARACLAQDVPPGWDYEVHAVDAGSTDGTAERLAAYGEAVTLHRRENIGQSGAFNLCLELDADVFLFCDGDDRIKPVRLRRVLQAFEAHPGAVMVGNAITEIDADSRTLREVYVGEDLCLDAREDADAERLHGLRCLLGTSRLAVRKAALAQVLPFDRTVLFEADEYLFNLLPALGQACILGERLTDYRLHGANNYQNGAVSLERVRRFRQVHDDLLASMRAARGRLGLSGRYVELCEDSLDALCRQSLALEQALGSRRQAVELILKNPLALGLVNAPAPKRMAYAAAAFLLGLQSSLSAYARLRGLLPKPGGPQSVRLA